MDPDFRYLVTNETPLPLWEFIEVVEKNLHRDLSIADFRNMTSYDPATLYRQIKEHIDPSMTVLEYHCLRRLQEARKILLAASPRKTKVHEVATMFGFKNHSHFSQRYKMLWGETPTATMRKAALARLISRFNGKGQQSK